MSWQLRAKAELERRRRLKSREIEWDVRLPEPHERQRAFIANPAKRKVIRAGRRGGKTIGSAILAVRAFRAGCRILYATPTQDQIDSFWWQVNVALQPMIDAGALYKNETRHLIEIPGTKQRLRAKTAWDADSLRGDYADLLILDEFQLMHEDAWNLVGAPMLLDNDGDAVFIYTPPSLRNLTRSKAKDPAHAAKLFKRAQQDETGRWAAFHFSSRDNPHISTAALAEITHDMTALAIRQEIEALDTDEAPGALWKRAQLDELRVTRAPDLVRIVVAVDPSATSTGDEAGIIVCGLGIDGHGYVLADASLQGSPHEWAQAAVTAYHLYRADALVAESNQGGDMVRVTISTIEGAPPVKLIHASRGKYTRAEPVAALYSQGRIHHIGTLPYLENEQCQWTPGGPSPNRLDAATHGLTELMLGLGDIGVS